jgi:hypothetical protein
MMAVGSWLASWLAGWMHKNGMDQSVFVGVVVVRRLAGIPRQEQREENDENRRIIIAKSSLVSERRSRSFISWLEAGCLGYWYE